MAKMTTVKSLLISVESSVRYEILGHRGHLSVYHGHKNKKNKFLYTGMDGITYSTAHNIIILYKFIRLSISG